MNTTILVLAAGSVSKDVVNDYPICLTEVDGQSLIEKIVHNTSSISNANYVFAIRERDSIQFHLDRVITLLVPTAKVIKVPDTTAGSACTSLLAICQEQGDAQFIIISANELIDIDFSLVLKDFNDRDLDAGTITFKSIHPRYSYVKLNEQGYVVEAAQQKPISMNATAGVFWFKKLSDFIDGAKNMIRKDNSVGEKFYVAPVFNELILLGGRIGAYQIDGSKYIPLKNDKQVSNYEQRRLA